jgi:hypothetical protein
MSGPIKIVEPNARNLSADVENSVFTVFRIWTLEPDSP